MNQKARQIVASYLAGEYVPLKELERACALLNTEDPEYVARLAREFALTADWTSECHAFRAQLAVFCDLSADERGRQMPVLVRHVEGCPSCRAAYWEVKGYWGEELVQGVKAAVKRLAEHIRIGIDAAGRLSEMGLCPPAMPVLDAVGRTQGKSAEEEALWASTDDLDGEAGVAAGSVEKRWVFADEEAGCQVCLSVEGVQEGGVRIRCWLETEAGADVRADEARMIVRKAETGTVWLDVMLKELKPPMPPVVLLHGSWLIALRVPSEHGSLEWSIPLDTEGIM